jgi:hypothetical protein
MRVDTNKVWQAIFAKLERFKNEKRVGLVSYDEESNAILFHRDDETENYRYWIPFNELQDFEGQLKWLYHIRGKGWFSVEVLNDFLDVLEYLGLRPPT